MKFQIGYYVVKKRTVFQNQFETAAWYENIAVEPGKYPLYAERFRYNEAERKEDNVIDGFILFQLPGVIESDNFQTLFHGCPVGSCYDTSKNAGKPGQYLGQTYPFLVAGEIIINPDGDENRKYELFPEYEAITKTFVSTIDGKKVTTCQLRRKEAAK